jgi:hypothetical protein
VILAAAGDKEAAGYSPPQRGSSLAALSGSNQSTRSEPRAAHEPFEQSVPFILCDQARFDLKLNLGLNKAPLLGR